MLGMFTSASALLFCCRCRPGHLAIFWRMEPYFYVFSVSQFLN